MPAYDQHHHVVPVSWVAAGAVPYSPPTVALCGSAHDAVHDLLNQYTKVGGLPSWEVRHRYGKYIRELAALAWERRPNDRPPVTTSHA